MKKLSSIEDLRTLDFSVVERFDVAALFKWEIECFVIENCISKIGDANGVEIIGEAEGFLERHFIEIFDNTDVSGPAFIPEPKTVEKVSDLNGMRIILPKIDIPAELIIRSLEETTTLFCSVIEEKNNITLSGEGYDHFARIVRSAGRFKNIMVVPR